MPGPKDRDARLAELAASIGRLDPEQRAKLYLHLLASRDDAGPFRSGARPQPVVGPTEHRRTGTPMRIEPLGDLDGSEFRPPEAREYLRQYGYVPPESLVPPTRKPKKVSLRLYDLDGVMPAFGREMMSRLAGHLARVDQWTDKLKGHLAEHIISFDVTRQSKEPTAQERADMPALVFPFYFISEKIGVGRSAKVARLHRIMDEHKVPVKVPGTAANIRRQVASEWESGIRAVTVPPGGLGGARRAPKCVFLKGDQMAREAAGNETYYSNVIIHEFGHACNIFGAGAHPLDGSAMEKAKTVNAMKSHLYAYNKRHATVISSTLALLSALAALLVLSAGCGGRVANVPCGGIKETVDGCHGCDAPSQLSRSAERALGSAVVASLVANDRRTGNLTDGVGDPLALRYFEAIPSDLYPTAAGDAPVVGGVGALDSVAKENPRRPVYLATFHVLGYAGHDRVLVRVEVVNHAWLGDRFYDEKSDAAYCVQRVGGQLKLHVLAPVFLISD